MIRLKRQTEYALISMLYMNRKGGTTTAREIAERYNLPFEITAKTLQKLKSKGLIQSIQGVQGGYVLDRGLDQISFMEFLKEVEGEQSVVACCSIEMAAMEKGDCDYSPSCEIRPFMAVLNTKIRNFISQIYLSELENPKLQAELISSQMHSRKEA